MLKVKKVKFKDRDDQLDNYIYAWCPYCSKAAYHKIKKMPTYCTKAIVLSAIPYSESSLICKLYTEEFGLKSYIIRSAKKKNSPTPTSHFQPLNTIEFEAYNSPKSKLETIKNSSLILENQSLNFSIIKNALTFFVAEVVHLSLKEANPNKELFNYLFNKTFLLKNSQDEDLAEFHLYFMIEFAEILGSAPMNNYSENSTLTEFNESLSSSIFRAFFKSKSSAILCST